MRIIWHKLPKQAEGCPFSLYTIALLYPMHACGKAAYLANTDLQLFSSRAVRTIAVSCNFFFRFAGGEVAKELDSELTLESKNEPSLVSDVSKYRREPPTATLGLRYSETERSLRRVQSFGSPQLGRTIIGSPYTPAARLYPPSHPRTLHQRSRD